MRLASWFHSRVVLFFHDAVAKLRTVAFDETALGSCVRPERGSRNHSDCRSASGGTYRSHFQHLVASVTICVRPEEDKPSESRFMTLSSEGDMRIKVLPLEHGPRKSLRDNAPKVYNRGTEVQVPVP